MTGVMVGSLLFGHLSDRYGRRPVFFLSLWAQVAFGVGVALTGNLYGFMAVRFFVGVIEQVYGARRNLTLLFCLFSKRQKYTLTQIRL